MGLMRAVFDMAFRPGMQRMKPQGPGWPVRLFHIDTGGCGGCGMELQALSCAPFDMQGAGFGFVHSPRNADMLVVTGPLTRAMAPVVQAAWEAMPAPRGLVCVGACALDGGMFGENYAVMGGLERRVSIDLAIPGCPPTPMDVLDGLRSLFRPPVPAPDTQGGVAAGGADGAGG
ncbi:NADH-quinone oxidoreductase subunit B [Acetobacter sp. TBRC 12305]|uniref:NADH-quinone oxidoreductase subunit B n=1 Tax=Acetobacter garciniae TaxID=2817435 RepID=A0A939HJB6_9PROT|nr:NADH-quinone oxidoreductase subunit B [Acetobacter garciniae]MBO1323790.1 NADH-quinone oxidoreductase subunit B [Acetobacter garciniae]MBX0343479.1 NADH-quinone oxidoreductase subunit B [Acetobacter garciniae]